MGGMRASAHKSGVSVQKSSAKQSSKRVRRNSNSNTAKSPQGQTVSTRWRSQKTLSPPVKDDSQGPEKRSISGNHRRSRSKTSMRPRSASGMQGMLADDRLNSNSAREQHSNVNFNNFRTSFEQRLL